MPGFDHKKAQETERPGPRACDPGHAHDHGGGHGNAAAAESLPRHEHDHGEHTPHLRAAAGDRPEGNYGDLDAFPSFALPAVEAMAECALDLRFGTDFAGLTLHYESMPTFKHSYDAIYGGGQYAWDPYVATELGGKLGGFADRDTGEAWINLDEADIGTIVHEVMHLKVHSDFQSAAGHELEEGASDVLAEAAVTDLDLDYAVAYTWPHFVLTDSLGASPEEVARGFFDGDFSALDATVTNGTFADYGEAFQKEDVAWLDWLEGGPTRPAHAIGADPSSGEDFTAGGGPQVAPVP